MSLAAVLRKHAEQLTQVETTYKQNVFAVNTLVTAVLSSSLPTLKTYPPDWQTFVAAYEQAGSDALQWVNTVMARLLQVPQDVLNYNTITTQLLQDAITQANTLVKQPSNAAALAALDQALTGLTTQLNLVSTFVSGAVTAVQHFQDVLPNLATQLQTIAQKSVQDAQADQQQINNYQADIAQLQADIKSLTAAIIALAIADGIALTLGTVATIALWPIGAVVWFVLAPAVAVATTYIALDASKIVADKAKIAADQQAITGLTADVATLTVLANSYAAMANQTQVVETSLGDVLAAWEALEADLTAAITDIRSAIADTQATNFAAVVNDLDEAVGIWTSAYASAGALQISLQVNTAPLEFGMSSGQVQAALASGQSMDIIAYYNQLSTTKV